VQRLHQHPSHQRQARRGLLRVSAGGTLIGSNIGTATSSQPGASQDNAVYPAWYTTATYFILAATWPAIATLEQIANASETLTTDWMALCRKITLGADAYISEWDANDPDRQKPSLGTIAEGCMS
jgi:hypothetical protein